jgi:RimJ/RimL family protein N-acetyltransferase
MPDDLEIRPYLPTDEPAIADLFLSIVAKGEEFAFPANFTREAAIQYWCRTARVTYVALRNGEFVGSYYIRPNHGGNGDHVCNGGYMVAESARGQGIATDLGHHSIAQAKRLGYQAMVFNVVVAANEPAIHLWQKLGFRIVGEVPHAFRHPTKGFVSTYVMHRSLEPSQCAA